MTDLQPEHEPTNTAAARRADGLGAHVLGFFAGMLAGLAFCQLPGGGFLGVVLGYLSPVPLFLSGLTGGRNVAITAMVFAVLAVALRLGLPAAAIFALLYALPVMILTRVALIDFGTAEAPRFINVSAVLLTALALGTLLLSCVASWFALYAHGIGAATGEVMATYKELLANSAPQLNAEQVSQSLELLRTTIPSMLLVGWFCIILLTGLAGQYLAVELRQNVRPSPKLKDIVLPLWLVGLFATCFVGSFFVHGDIAMVLSAFATLYALGFMLGGMAEMHRYIDRRTADAGWTARQRFWLYAFIYGATLILQIPALILLLTGLIAPFTLWRHNQRTVTGANKP